MFFRGKRTRRFSCSALPRRTMCMMHTFFQFNGAPPPCQGRLRTGGRTKGDGKTRKSSIKREAHDIIKEKIMGRQLHPGKINLVSSPRSLASATRRSERRSLCAGSGRAAAASLNAKVQAVGFTEESCAQLNATFELLAEGACRLCAENRSKRDFAVEWLLRPPFALTESNSRMAGAVSNVRTGPASGAETGGNTVLHAIKPVESAHNIWYNIQNADISFWGPPFGEAGRKFG